MIVRTLQALEGTEREVHGATWTSRRLLLAADGLGYSMHDTVLHAGTETRMWYRRHVEVVYCVAGEGELLDVASGTLHAIGPGTLYALDAHDPHVLRAKTELRMICVFTPALHGPEVHDADGSYPLLSAQDPVVGGTSGEARR
jgi:L-ectoine synthase